MVNCKYCGESTSNKNLICNNCKNKLNAKKYLKDVLVNFKPNEVFSKRNLGLYLDKSFNVDIVLLTLNDYGMVLRRGSHGYKLATKEAIDEFLSQEDLTQIKSRKTKKSSKGKSKKVTKSKSSPIKRDFLNTEHEVFKKCKICGSDLPSNSKNDVCRKCSKKSHAVNVLEEIIPITGVGIPFKKEDFNNLYKNNPIKANDTIWTLQDFNLVKSLDNNTFELVSEDKLNQFFKENNSSSTVSDLLSKTSANALQKTCLKCNKALPISEFRKISENQYSDYCKSCDKKIRTASYVIEFINSVGFDEFKINEINIENAQGKIFNLQDNDLIKFNGNSYQLADEEIVYSYINQNTDDNTQFENILEAFKEDFTMIQAANSVGVSNVEVTRYYIEGKNGNPKYVHFFNEINKIKKNKLEKNACPKCKSKSGYFKDAKCKKCGYVNISLLSLDEKMDFVLSHIKENNSVKSAKELDIPYENVKNWNKLGKAGLSPYDKFYKGIINIKEESKENAIKRSKIAPIEERLNEYLRKIQRTELSLDKNIIKLKSIDITNKEIKSEYEEINSEINIMKNDLILQKNEIKSIKDNLPKYSLEQLDNIKEFDIKNAKSISTKVNKLLKKNDMLAQKELAEVKKHEKNLENQLSECKRNIGEVNVFISKLNETNFVESLKYRNAELINELLNYKTNLEENITIIENNLFDLKSKKQCSNVDILEINYIDYSSKVNDLISKNSKLTSKQMKLVLDNLDESKEIKTISEELNISFDDVNLWYDLGKSGNKDYIDFYEKISKFKENKKKLLEEKENKKKLLEEKDDKKKLSKDISSFSKTTESVETKEKSSGLLNKLKNRMSADSNKNTDKSIENSVNNKSNDVSQYELVLKYYGETKDLIKASNLANVPIFLVKFWYNEGKKGNVKYTDFYNQINNIKKP